jgi:hypothetical protein
MKTSTGCILLVILTLGCTALPAADSKYGLAADNRIRAQALVAEIMAANPELLTAGMHCVPPGGQAQAIIASTLNVIGKPSDPEDILHGSTIIVPNLKVPKLGIMLPLHDSAGKEIGSLALQFKFQPGQDQVKYLAQATAIRDQVAKKIPALGDLFTVVP